MRQNTVVKGLWETMPGLTQRMVALHALEGAQHMSMAAIAGKLSREFNITLTKNAIIGKSRRLALAARAPRPIEAKPRIYKYKPRLRIVPKPARTESGTVSFHDMRWDDCHFPLGDYPHLYCGREVSAGSSYCAAHYRLTHMAPRKVWE